MDVTNLAASCEPEYFHLQNAGGFMQSLFFFGKSKNAELFTSFGADSGYASPQQVALFTRKCTVNSGELLDLHLMWI